MPKSSTNVEPKGKKDNLKRKSGGSTNKHVEVNVEVVNGANGAKTDLQDLAALWKQGFAHTLQYAQTHTHSKILSYIFISPLKT